MAAAPTGEAKPHPHPGRSGIAVDVSGVGAGQVRGNADDLGRVVQNLLDNAIRHAAGRVAISLAADGDGHVVLHVDDDGPGVDPSIRADIFERFTRADAARTRDTGGAGLGLAIAHEIVRDHGGSIMVGAGPLGGARFTVRLHDARSD